MFRRVLIITVCLVAIPLLAHSVAGSPAAAGAECAACGVYHVVPAPPAVVIQPRPVVVYPQPVVPVAPVVYRRHYWTPLRDLLFGRYRVGYAPIY